jgi:hypothetical protein
MAMEKLARICGSDCENSPDWISLGEGSYEEI